MNIGTPLRLLAAAALASAAVLSSSALANRDRDNDRALRAVEQGEALSLAEILDRIRPQLLGGEVVDVAFERTRGRWIYELKVIDRSGHLREFYVDAANAEILQREGH